MRPLLIALAATFALVLSSTPAQADDLPTCVVIGAVHLYPPLPPFTYDPPDICVL